MIYTVPANYPGHGRRVYPGFLQHAGFVAMNPDRHVSSHYDYYLNLVEGDKEDAEAHVRFYDEYNAVLDMAAEYYLDTIRDVFQEFHLANGTWVVDGKPVRPEDIKGTALFTIEGELDDISGSGQTEAAQDLCSSIPNAQAAPDRAQVRPLRHLLWPALARVRVSAAARLHPPLRQQHAHQSGRLTTAPAQRKVIPTQTGPELPWSDDETMS